LEGLKAIADGHFLVFTQPGPETTQLDCRHFKAYRVLSTPYSHSTIDRKVLPYSSQNLVVIKIACSMLARKDMKKLAWTRIKDAEALLDADRLDGATYVCGYAVELCLKERICRTLKWQGYPHGRGEFQDYSSFRTHKLEVLLRLTGREAYVKKSFMAEWSAVMDWSPETRYEPNRAVNKTDVRYMIASAKILLGKL
jgi:hypothetical protein